MRTFDFTSNRSLSKDEVVRLDAIGGNMIAHYNTLISDVGKLNRSSLSWWSTDLASRYSLGSTLFDDLCLFFLFLRHFDEYDRVLVDDWNWYRMVLKIKVKHNASFTIIYQKKHFKKTILAFKAAVRFVRSCLTLFFRKIYANKAKRYDLLDKKIVLIRNYILYSDSSELRDRCFANYRQAMLDAGCSDVFYFPILPGPNKTFVSHLKKMKKLGSPVILIYHYLSILDCFKITGIIARSAFLTFSGAFIHGMDCRRVLRKEFIKNYGSILSFEALGFYFAIKNMKKKGINIGSYICWYEGQSIDKLLSLAVRKYFPESRFVGYQGFLQSKYNLANIPTPYEIEQRLVPKVLTSCVYHIINKLNSLNLDLDFDIAPAFRLLSGADHTETRVDQSSSSLLVVLGLNFLENKMILSVVDEACNNSPSEVPSLLIRPHPADTHSIPIINKLVGRYRFVSLSNDELSRELSRSHIVFGAATSVLVEALSLGAIICVLMSNKSITRNVFDELKADGESINLVYDAGDLLAVIRTCIAPQEKTKIMRKSPLITPASKDNVDAFLSLCLD